MNIGPIASETVKDEMSTEMDAALAAPAAPPQLGSRLFQIVVLPNPYRPADPTDDGFNWNAGGLTTIRADECIFGGGSVSFYLRGTAHMFSSDHLIVAFAAGQWLDVQEVVSSPIFGKEPEDSL